MKARTSKTNGSRSPATPPRARSACNPLTAAARPEPGIQIKEILVPVDLSASSKKAVAYAVAFARQFHAAVTLLHVVDPDCRRDGQNTSARHSSEVQWLAQIQKQLAALTEQSVRGRAQCETLIRFGSPHMEIETAARKQGVDLIILATHGDRGLPDFCFASTTEKVLRYAPCPVLIVRQQERDFV